MNWFIVSAFTLSLVSAQVDPPRIWLFASDGRKRPYYFLNDVGTLTGFDVDIINSVCAIAGKKCSMVLSDFTECTYSVRDINYPGRGLMAGWFDACSGYAITVDRENAFDFTMPYLDTVSTFTVAPGNPSNFQPSATDFSQYTLTHLTGAPTNAQCLKRLKKVFDKIVIAKDLPEAKALLLNNTGGAGIMVKKGSELPSWWNSAFQSFYYSGGYDALCKAASVKYNYPIRCLAQPTHMEKPNMTKPLLWSRITKMAKASG